jgi:ABC-2 type transport system permease protein
MTVRMALATAHRVPSQVRRDRRTVGLLVIVPCLLLVLMRYVFYAEPHTFQHIGAPLCGLFPFILMFLVTSITMLRERTTGTLERLMTLPLAKLNLLTGYGIAFDLLATIQAGAVCAVGFLALGLNAPHGAWLVALLAVGNALLGMALGLFVSAFARTEFQAVQFMPAVVFPQMLLCGLFVARGAMAPLLYDLSWALPLTYAYEALERATKPAVLTTALLGDVLVIIAATLAALDLGALTLRRRSP